MRRRPMIAWMVLIAGCSAAVYAQLRERPPSPTLSGAYRVTPWPEHGGVEQKYEDEVQEFLNRMAGDGWRYHSDLVGQFGKLMIFERSSGR